MKKLIIPAILAMAASCGPNTVKTTEHGYSIPEPASFIEGTGKVIPQNGVIEILAEAAGKVSATEIRTGSHVKKEEILVRLAASDAEQDVVAAGNRFKTQQARVKEAETLFQKSRLEYEQAVDEAEKTRRLFEKGAENENNAVTLENDCRIKQMVVDERENALLTARCLLSEYAGDLKTARLNLEKYTVTAPCNGKVLELSARTGEMVRPYDIVAVFAPDEPMVVLAEVDEIFASMLEIGQTATVFPVGYQNKIATGTIYEISDMLTSKSIFSGSSSEKKDRRVRKIRILLDDQDQPPLVGKKVTCKIHLK